MTRLDPMYQEQGTPFRSHGEALIVICHQLLRDLAANACVLPINLDLAGQTVKVEKLNYSQNQITITVVK